MGNMMDAGPHRRARDRQEARMSDEHAPTDDIFYDLVSIQYHALKGAEVYDKYLEDAHEHEDVADFIREVKEQDAQRAVKAHQLLGELSGMHSKI
jgi:hypothetical protein